MAFEVYKLRRCDVGDVYGRCHLSSLLLLFLRSLFCSSDGITSYRLQSWALK